MSGRSSLSATIRFIAGWTAWYTVPIPPLPSTRTIWYLPSAIGLPTMPSSLGGSPTPRPSHILPAQGRKPGAQPATSTRSVSIPYAVGGIGVARAHREAAGEHVGLVVHDQ